MKRREIIYYILLGVFTISIVLFMIFRDKTPELLKRERLYDSMDTVVTVRLYGTDEDDVIEKLKGVGDIYDYYHKLSDKYNKYDGVNNVYVINKNAGKSPVKVEQDLFDLIEYSLSFYEKSNGQLNVLSEPVLGVWHDYREACDEGMQSGDPSKCKVPELAELEEAKTCTDINGIILDKEELTVYLEEDCMGIDLGAVAKGYTTEKVADYFNENGYEYFLINAGGNVRVGKHPDGRDWHIGLEDPTQPFDVYGSVDLTDYSSVTSGDYQRYYVVDEKRYHHIISPDTLFPAEYYRSATIICEDSGLADIMSTSIYLLPYEESVALVESMDGVEAIWYFSDDTVKYSSGFNDYLNTLKVEVNE